MIFISSPVLFVQGVSFALAGCAPAKITPHITLMVKKYLVGFIMTSCLFHKHNFFRGDIIIRDELTEKYTIGQSPTQVITPVPNRLIKSGLDGFLIEYPHQLAQAVIYF